MCGDPTAAEDGWSTGRIGRREGGREGKVRDQGGCSQQDKGFGVGWGVGGGGGGGAGGGGAGPAEGGRGHQGHGGIADKELGKKELKD